MTKDEKKVNDRENSWTYDLRTGRQVYVEGSFTGSYYNAANFEFTIKNVRYQVYNLQSEHPTIEAYADSVHWQHGENDTYRRSVEKKGNATVVTLYNGGAEDDWEGTTEFGYYDYFVTNDAGIVQRRESANLPYHQVHRYLNRGQAWWFYPVSGLPSYYFVIMYDFSYLYSTEVPEDADKILPELKSFEEDYAKAKKAWDAAMAELEAVTIHTTGGPIVTPEGEIEDPNADSKKTDVTVDTPAGTTAGEDAGTTIPAIIILGTLGAAAALAGAAGGESGEDDKKKRSQFRMYISKNFGAALKKGAPPQEVYARIAEITPEGREIPRPDLTEEIRVYSSDDSLIVKDGGTANGYRRAVVSVYDTEDQPPEGKVSFFFEGEGGTFTQNVIFNITVPGIKFFQENLTLPAGILEEPEFLPFEVSEMGDKYEIELSY
ncbi:MAG: hypothetical protein IJR89_07680, partial [Clostridia bacterium]|nr:hypothetical protein [Clostridia bacterium]